VSNLAWGNMAVSWYQVHVRRATGAQLYYIVPNSPLTIPQLWWSKELLRLELQCRPLSWCPKILWLCSGVEC
jgi:hypothetical protein